MANPQLENGHISIANELVEVLARTQLNGYETRYLWVLWRKTYGWKKKEDVVSNSQFVEATGLKKQHIRRTEKRLIDRKVVTKNGYKMSFNKDYHQWKQLPKMVTVTNSGVSVTKNGGHKRNYTKQNKKLLLHTGVTKIGYTGERTSQQLVIEYYKIIKGFDKMANWDKVYFSRFMRDAGNVIKLIPYSPTALKAIERIGKYFDSKSLDWNLSTVVSYIPEYLKELGAK